MLYSRQRHLIANYKVMLWESISAKYNNWSLLSHLYLCLNFNVRYYPIILICLRLVNFFFVICTYSVLWYMSLCTVIYGQRGLLTKASMCLWVDLFLCKLNFKMSGCFQLFHYKYHITLRKKLSFYHLSAFVIYMTEKRSSKSGCRKLLNGPSALAVKMKLNRRLPLSI